MGGGVKRFYGYPTFTLIFRRGINKFGNYNGGLIASEPLTRRQMKPKRKYYLWTASYNYLGLGVVKTGYSPNSFLENDLNAKNSTKD